MERNEERLRACREGRLVREVARIGLLDSIPIEFDATRKGPRQIGWRADKGCVLKWTEAQDEGDPAKFPDASPRDVVYAVDLSERGSGDGGAPQQMAATELRYAFPVAWSACTYSVILCMQGPPGTPTCASPSSMHGATREVMVAMCCAVQVRWHSMVR